jgi:hypothetical protein
MANAELIEKSIMRLPKCKPFFAETVSSKYPINAVRQVIKSLLKKNQIVSISRGMYVRPRSSRYLKKGEYLIVPQPEDIIRLIAKKTGETIIHNQWAALNYVGLSTQIPVRPIYYTSGRSRVIKLKRGADIRLKHINSKRIVMPGTVTCLVVTALWDRRSSFIHPLSIKRIHERLTSEEYAEVIKNLDKMPEWIREAFVQYQSMKPGDPRLEEW